MSVDLSNVLDLHRRILSDLDLRETATTEKEAAARKAFEEALHNIAAERQAINQYRNVLAEAQHLYQNFAGTSQDGTSGTASGPSEVPVAAGSPQQTLAPDPGALSEEPQHPATEEEPAPQATSLNGASLEREVSPLVENLRSHISANSEQEGRGGNWWSGMWKSGSRDSQQEISWKEALRPVDGAERAVWDHQSAK
jgi:hypothetical protein